MKIQTMSIVCGTRACNAHCPFCVSKMTPDADLSPTNINWRNLGVACRLAEKAGATTCLITGKGEPTLYPDLVTQYIERVSSTFPFIELQTNGMRLKNLKPELFGWIDKGLTTICLSAVETGFANKKIYGDDYPDIAETASLLNRIGFTIRLSIMMLKGYIYQPKDIQRVVEFCKINNIKQLTLRPIASPETEDGSVAQWVKDHTLNQHHIETIEAHVQRKGTPVLKLAHGATVYDYEGQNICLSNCLTTNETDENMRQIIFFPDGTIGYDWKYKGAVLL